MALEKAVITAAESQVTLAAEADWMALDEALQATHIGYGSIYVQTKWTCIDEDTCLEIDWTDAPDDIKEAVAYFALANLRLVLYPAVNTQTAVSEKNITEITKKLGTMQKTIKYDAPGVDYPNGLMYPETLMDSLCSKSGVGGAVKAVRC